jgi:hypothetical protein
MLHQAKAGQQPWTQKRRQIVTSSSFYSMSNRLILRSRLNYSSVKIEASVFVFFKNYFCSLDPSQASKGKD